MKKIGFTSTIPVEVLFAAKAVPLDLNNIFISAKNPNEYIDIAELKGFPRSFCAWIKGLYGAIHANDIKTIIGIMEGDCSDTRVLVDILKREKLEVIGFAYPYDRSFVMMKNNIEELMRYFNVSWEDVFYVHQNLQKLREKIYLLDKLSYTGFDVRSFDLHLYQVSASDFFGDLRKFDEDITKYLASIKKTDANYIRLGYIGVPPIITDLYQFVDENNARIMFHEVDRQFSFPMLEGKQVEATVFPDFYIRQYLDYTYPYDIEMRLKDIKHEIKKRKLDGIIHYVQSFCHRQAYDKIFREELGVPVLTLEEDRPEKLSSRTKIRLEAFIGMLNKIDK